METPRADATHVARQGRFDLRARLAALGTLRNPAYRYVVLSAMLNNMAKESRMMAQAWLILALTNSDAWVGGVAGLPALLAAASAPLGGVFADRWDRRRMLMLVRLALSATALLTALLVGGELIRIWHLLALAFVISVLDVSGLTAGQTMIIDAVPREELFNANALFSAALNLALVLGPALVGVILAQADVSWAFGFSALLYIGSALAASRIYVGQQQKESHATSVWFDLQEGVRFVRQTSVLQWLLIVGLSGIAVGVWFALVPRFAKDVLESGATGYGAILSARGRRSGGRAYVAFGRTRTAHCRRAGGLYGRLCAPGHVLRPVHIHAGGDGNRVWVGHRLRLVSSHAAHRVSVFGCGRHARAGDEPLFDAGPTFGLRLVHRRRAIGVDWAAVCHHELCAAGRGGTPRGLCAVRRSAQPWSLAAGALVPTLYRPIQSRASIEAS